MKKTLLLFITILSLIGFKAKSQSGYPGAPGYGPFGDPYYTIQNIPEDNTTGALWWLREDYGCPGGCSIWDYIMWVRDTSLIRINALDTDNIYLNGNVLVGVSDNGTLSRYHLDTLRKEFYNKTQADSRFLQTEIDGSATNELQTLSISSQSLSISNGNTIVLPSTDLSNYYTKTQSDSRYLQSEVDGSITNEIQSLSINSGSISISGGNTIVLPDASSNNELQTLSINTNTLSISNGNNVVLPTYNQTLSINSNSVSISNGNTITLPVESQTLTLSTNTLSISGGNSVTLPTYNQTLSISSNSISISNGNTITIPFNVNTLTAMTTKSLNVAYQVSTTNDSKIYVSAQLSCALSLSGGTDGSIVLEVSPNGSTGWVYSGQIDGSNTGTLTVGLNTTQKTGSQLTAPVKAGYYWRLRTVTNTGTPTFTWNGGSYELF